MSILFKYIPNKKPENEESCNVVFSLAKIDTLVACVFPVREFKSLNALTQNSLARIRAPINEK